MKIGLLHTAEVHVATFEALFAGRNAVLEHVVAPDLLARARAGGLGAVRGEVLGALHGFEADAVMCTCSTLGPLADEVARVAEHVFRIDRPLMERAVAEGAIVLVAICLESTRDATLDLLADVARAAGRVVTPRVVLCAEAWALFEQGDLDGYAAEIARAIDAALIADGPVDCVVLAQASMRVAEGRLGALGIPVHSSPPLAVERALEIASKMN